MNFERRAAVYRVLYGKDFLVESLRSVLPFVDVAFVFWTDRPWGSATHVVYRGERVRLPVREGEPFDGWRDRLDAELTAAEKAKVRVVYDRRETPKNQFTLLVHERVAPEWGRPDLLLCVEADHVCDPSVLDQALGEMRRGGFRCGHTAQVELWRTPEWRVPERPNRTGLVLWNLMGLRDMPPTKFQGEPYSADWTRFRATIHNCGFLVSEKTMLLKHLCALAFSGAIGDSVPREEWYEDVWKAWRPGDENLEIARGWERAIPRAVPNDLATLPKALRERFGAEKVA